MGIYIYIYIHQSHGVFGIEWAICYLSQTLHVLYADMVYYLVVLGGKCRPYYAIFAEGDFFKELPFFQEP